MQKISREGRMKDKKNEALINLHGSRSPAFYGTNSKWVTTNRNYTLGGGKEKCLQNFGEKPLVIRMYMVCRNKNEFLGM